MPLNIQTGITGTSATEVNSQMNQDVTTVAPLATSWSGAYKGNQLNQQINTPSTAGASNLSKFTSFMGGIADGTGNLAVGAADWIKTNLTHLAESPAVYTRGIYRGIEDHTSLSENNSRFTNLNDQQTRLMDQFKNGLISRKQLGDGMKDLYPKFLALSKDNEYLNKKIGLDAKQTTQAAIDTAAVVVTVMTAGIGAADAGLMSSVGLLPENAMAVSDFLASKVAQPIFDTAESLISKLGTDSKAFGLLDNASQWAVQRATAEVAASTTSSMTASSIARTSAVNLALKYPLVFNALSGTGKQLYAQLDDAKYGSAMLTLAFNGLMLLSGGPIEEGLGLLGKGVSGLKTGMFGEGSYFDELSTYFGDGSRDGFSKAALTNTEGMTDVQRSTYMRDLRAHVATNLGAVGGDTKAAAYRTAYDMKSRYNRSLSDITHEDAMNEMVNHIQAYRRVDTEAKAMGLGAVSVGRVDARDLEDIGTQLAKANPEDRLKVWNDMKLSNQNRAWAHNQSFDEQIQNIIKENSKETTAPPPVVKATETPATTVATPTKTQVTSAIDRSLPRDLKGAKPNYSYGQNRFTLNFKDDLTKALYIVAGKSGSAKDAEYLAYLKQHFPNKSTTELRTMGADIRTSIKNEARTSTNDSITVDSHAAVKKLPTSTTRTVTTEPKQPSTSTATAEPPQAVSGEPAGAKELRKAVGGISASFRVKGFSTETNDWLAQKGYLPIKPVNLEAPFKEGAGKELRTEFNNPLFLKLVKPLPVMSHLGVMLTKMGMSPLGARERVYQLLNEAFAKNITQTKAAKALLDNLIPVGSKATTVAERDAAAENVTDSVLKVLSDFAHQPTRGGLKVGKLAVRPPIMDLRQLTDKDIVEAFKNAGVLIDKNQARELGGALMKSHQDVEFAIKSAGDRAVDFAYHLPGFSRYSRIQGAYRFSWNPIFAEKSEIKTEILTQLKQGHWPSLPGMNGILSRIFPEHYAQLDAFREVMRQNGFLENTASRLGALVNEAGMDEQAFRGPTISHSLYEGQERSIAAMVMTQAKRMDMTPQDFLKTNPYKVSDTIQAIVGYDRNNGFLNSPMMRTLNVAFFPLRFETKVATAFLKAASKTDVMTQFALIKGLFSARDFMQSPAGQAWYAQNADVIGLAEYFSPLDIMSSVASVLGTGGTSLGAYGELGGLPFGWIPQMTDALGLTHLGTSSPLISNQTGEVIPAYVPANNLGKFQIAIEDLIGSLYSYPGAEIGLPSKSSIDRNVVNDASGGALGKQNTTLQTPKLTTNAQKEYQHIIQMQTGNKPLTPEQGQPPRNPDQIVQMPAFPSSIKQPLATEGTAAGTGNKKKEAQFAPQLPSGENLSGVQSAIAAAT